MKGLSDILARYDCDFYPGQSNIMGALVSPFQIAGRKQNLNKS